MKTLEEHRHDAAVERSLAAVATHLERLADAAEVIHHQLGDLLRILDNAPPDTDPAPEDALAASGNPADNPQPTPWRLGALGVPEIYDAAGDLVTAVGNDFSSMAGDMANARRIVEAVNERAAREEKGE